MEIKPIRIEADYEAALEEIERLWGSAFGSREGDRADLPLGELVGETVRFRLAAQIHPKSGKPVLNAMDVRQSSH